MDLNFEKNNGLIPAIIQDANTRRVLMMGYMNREAWEKTQSGKLVTFYSRSRKTLWTKGETSGNFLHFVDAKPDCDHDTLLIRAIPDGPVCHMGTDTCWGEENIQTPGDFLKDLEDLLKERKTNRPVGSYTVKLFDAGIKKIAQKVGEEAVETILEAENGTDERFLSEAADLLYHLLTLLVAKELSLNDLVEELERRRREG
ncbi:MAG: bifunctional phosphoribosyl-AMP cyclohydrolase/phosphoribosyl-ATP diphosphatase HisIE [Chlorobi bacterium]|nr:bifunctional phosphoribosyl-AMP cyclohydrolase/phosphoribosyl-ATP diphosphatase HisIE [Chlorobiota bacterium]